MIQDPEILSGKKDNVFACPRFLLNFRFYIALPICRIIKAHIDLS